MTKLLITGAWNCSIEQQEQLQQMGYDICFVQYEKDELPEEAYFSEVVVCNGLFQYHDIEKFTKLKAIQLTSAGFDRVPMEYIVANGIEIFNARDVYSKPIAEFVICGILQLYKQSRFFYENQKKHQWIKHRGLLELTDKVVCIIGTGSIGTACARCFESFDCKVIGIGRTPIKQKHYMEIVGFDQLDNILKNADIVLLSIPSNKETYHFLNKKKLSLLKDDAVIVNVSRGNVIDTQALLDVLPNIRGAILDVFEKEPIDENSKLWDLDNVILSPHNSFVGEKNEERLAKVIFRNMSFLIRKYNGE